ncbi:hypothetical protein TAO_1796 [Candidatus Nitrosoglobus terrae]|uniref:Uncharacterized protein n=1 Tax=Candidatus Nitrosoglobus terrae TaxID=1630141 RepID=A0A1Q2SPX3_9GAMM|nr:hypothetical protein TAO_1796 [Candidatus Nitrosoglobus terrae]
MSKQVGVQIEQVLNEGFVRDAYSLKYLAETANNAIKSNRQTAGFPENVIKDLALLLGDPYCKL